MKLSKITNALVLSVIAYGGQSLATPLVGDYAKYNMNVQQNGQSINGQLEMSILSTSAQNTQYDVRTTITIQGQPPKVTEKQSPANSLLNNTQISTIVNNCAQSGGVPGTFNSAQGAIPICHLIQSANKLEMDIAQVPFGFVHMTQVLESGARVELTIVQSHSGQ